MSNKSFRSDLKLTREKIEQFFPNSTEKLSIEKVLRDCSELASQLNNSNWNINFDGSFIRFNCGARYVLNINSSRIRVMCLRNSFLKLGKEFISEFILTHSLYLEDSSKLLGVKIPRNYEEFIAIPTENLWHNSVQFEIPIDEWTTNYSKILTPSILDFAKDCINQSSIMTQMKTAHSPAIIELINEDLNEELIQPSYPKAENGEETQFTWIPFYQEMAKKLLEYKDKRSELVKIVFSLDREFVSYIYDENGNDYPDIDPFSVFAIFNRQISNERRLTICEYLKKALNIQAEIPSDFNSLPVMNNQNSVFVYRSEILTSINPLWTLFDLVLQPTLNEVSFCSQFELIQKQKGIKWNITMGLYWIKPYQFIGLDSNNRAYLLNEKNTSSSFIQTHLLKEVPSGKEYLQIIEEIKNFAEDSKHEYKSFPELSYLAWKKETASSSEDNMQQSNFVKDCISLLKSNHNIILHGAPGTGKSYLAKEIACLMRYNKKYDDLTDEEKKDYDDQKNFVQFHPSYDYTDFVEGLRPIKSEDGSSIGFERKDGVFKTFCERAIQNSSVESVDENLFSELNKNPTVWKISLEGTGDNPVRKDCLENNYIRIGWSGYKDVNFDEFENFEDGGKNILRAFQATMEIGDIVVSCWSATETDAIGIITGEYEYNSNGGSYPRYRRVKWLVKNIREKIVEINNGKTFTLSTVYKSAISVSSALDIVKKYTSTTKTANITKKPFIFIIDEINRGEMSKIFGELFFSIDPGYRGFDENGKPKGLVQTQYQNLVDGGEFVKGFYVPENVYIIGTMNDIDRSVESMDFAMRRRFIFKEITAAESALNMKLSEDATDRMTNLNKAISGIEGLNSSYHIGGAYFQKEIEIDGEMKRVSVESEDFDNLWELKLEPLLKEYLRGMEDADEKLEKLKDAYENNDVNESEN